MRPMLVLSSKLGCQFPHHPFLPFGGSAMCTSDEGLNTGPVTFQLDKQVKDI